MKLVYTLAVSAGMLTVALAACGTSGTNTVTDRALTFSKARIFQVSRPDNALEIATDGTLSLDGKAAGKIHADGTIYDTHGRLKLTLKPDGQLMTPQGQALSLRLTADNTLVGPNGSSRFDGSGAFVGGNPDSPKIGSVGCTGPTVRSCLVAVAVMLSAFSENATPVMETLTGAQKLTLAAASFQKENSPTTLTKILVDGRIKLKGTVRATVKADGRIVANDGELKTQLLPDGRMVFGDGRDTGVKVLDNGFLHVSTGTKITLDAAGTLQGPSTRISKIVTKGCEGAMARTCLYVIALFHVGHTVSPAPPPR